MKPFIQFVKFGNGFSKRLESVSKFSKFVPWWTLVRAGGCASARLLLRSWPGMNPRDKTPQSRPEDNSMPQVSNYVAPMGTALTPLEAWPKVVLAQDCLNSAAPQKGVMPHDCAISNPRQSPIVAWSKQARSYLKCRETYFPVFSFAGVRLKNYNDQCVLSDTKYQF